MGSTFLCIDLKSYYASVECVERGLDPLTTNLVVADESRTDKTICLAVSPSLKAYGVPGRARLFEVKQRLEEVRRNTGEVVHFITACPRMQLYQDVSAQIYGILLSYAAPEDIHVYSIDEAFLDVTHYLSLYKASGRDLAARIIRDILGAVGVTATAGIGPNLYLAKVAMDIVAKKTPPNADGVRIAQLDKINFRQKLWGHQPITDFWGIGGGIGQRLKKLGIHTMGDLALFSTTNQEALFREFGVNAEILIDHAWGEEPTQMIHIKNYRPSTTSLSEGQVLKRAYSYEEAKLVVREMTERVTEGLAEKGLLTQGLTFYAGYDGAWGSGRSPASPLAPTEENRIPSSAHGTAKLGAPTISPSLIMRTMMGLVEEKLDPRRKVRRLAVCAIRLRKEEDAPAQISLFSDGKAEQREISLLKAEIALHKRYGRNALYKGRDLMEAATTMERNRQIGGHKA